MVPQSGGIGGGVPGHGGMVPNLPGGAGGGGGCTPGSTDWSQSCNLPFGVALGVL